MSFQLLLPLELIDEEYAILFSVLKEPVRQIAHNAGFEDYYRSSKMPVGTGFTQQWRMAMIDQGLSTQLK